jgi:YD repeat-containing protein
MIKIIPAWTPRIGYPEKEYTMKNHMALPFLLLVCLIAVACLLVVFPALGSDNITYTYDANGRLLKADYGGGKSFTYTYDKAGNILTETVVGSTGPTYPLQVSVSPTGSGGVTGGGINCPSQCSKDIAQNQQVSLTAAGQTGYKFLGWGGDASGTSNPVLITMNAAKNVTAYFGSTSGITVPGKGISDVEEMGPSGNNPAYDGNGDGIPDYQQGNVASFHANTGGAYVTLAVPPGQTLANVQASGNPSPGNAPAGVNFPYGFFTFTVNGITTGACTTVTLYLPSTPSLNTYYKYGRTPDNQTDHWYEFMYNGTMGAEIIQEATQTRVVLHFCDGQRGDDDLQANGTIVDQGAPGEQQQITAVPTLNEWGMIAFIGLMGIALLYFIRRRRI